MTLEETELSVKTKHDGDVRVGDATRRELLKRLSYVSDSMPEMSGAQSIC